MFDLQFGAVLAGATALSLFLSTLALGCVLAVRRDAVHLARRAGVRAVKKHFRAWMGGHELRLAQLEADGRTVNFVLNDRGFLKGRKVVPDPELKLFTDQVAG